MGELLRCKVRKISKKSAKKDRWEIRLENKILPPAIMKIGGTSITLKFSNGNYIANTGIACRGCPYQFFWINTLQSVSGELINILKAHHYKRNEEILLHISHEDELIAYVVRLA